MIDISKENLVELYFGLQKIRKTELKIEELYHLDDMKTPVHLCLGQEAVSVGVCASLRKEDYIFSNHRGHGHYLAKGGDLKAMIAELYCKDTGCSRGRGGSMHLIDTSVGHLGSSAIVGGGISHAVGAALAFKFQKKDLVAVAFFGDAATEEGVFYESMNLAAFHKLPVVFICENNSYSVCTHISYRESNDNIYKRANAFDIPSVQVDGMDVLKVLESSKQAIDHARGGNGPYFIEYKVQRWRGHAGSGDPNREHYRIKEDQDDNNVRDPLTEFTDYLLKNGLLKEDAFRAVDSEIDQEVEEAFKYAQESPLPDKGDLLKYLYSK